MSFFQPDSSPELSRDHNILVDFLMPTGVLIPLVCGATQKLEKIKNALWQMAREYPLFGFLRLVSLSLPLSLELLVHDVYIQTGWKTAIFICV